MEFRVKELGIFLAVVLCGGIAGIGGRVLADDNPAPDNGSTAVSGAAGTHSDFSENENAGDRSLRYEIRSQVLESGKRLCDLDYPEYASAADGTQVCGKLIWYSPETGTTLDENRTLTGENGTQLALGWRFLPTGRWQDYKPASGEIVVTLRSASQNADGGRQNGDGTAANRTESSAAASQDSSAEKSDTDNMEVTQTESRTTASQNDIGENSDADDTNESQADDGTDASRSCSSACSDADTAETTRSRWNALISAMAADTGVGISSGSAAGASASGRTSGAVTVTVIPEGEDPSSWMGSITTGVGALGCGAETEDVTETEETSSSGTESANRSGAVLRHDTEGNASGETADSRILPAGNAGMASQTAKNADPTSQTGKNADPASQTNVTAALPDFPGKLRLLLRLVHKQKLLVSGVQQFLEQNQFMDIQMTLADLDFCQRAPGDIAAMCLQAGRQLFLCQMLVFPNPFYVFANLLFVANIHPLASLRTSTGAFLFIL